MPDTQLLNDILAVVDEDESRVWSRDVVDRLASSQPVRYQGWDATSLAMELRAFNVKTKQTRIGDRVLAGIERRHIVDAATRQAHAAGRPSANGRPCVVCGHDVPVDHARRRTCGAACERETTERLFKNDQALRRRAANAGVPVDHGYTYHELKTYLSLNARCWICDATEGQLRTGERLHIDHVKPIAAGGPHTPSNLRLVCPGCNVRKGSTWPLSSSDITELRQRAMEPHCNTCTCRQER